MKTLLTIMAHREAQETFDRHLPFWAVHGYPMAVMCPKDSPVRTGLQMFQIGTKGHHGAHATERFRLLLEALECTEYERFIVMEYDALCLSALIPPVIWQHDRLWCNRFVNNERGSKFSGTQFFHPPLIFSRRVLVEILGTVKVEEISDRDELGFWDRWLGFVADRAAGAFSPQDYGRLGFSRNTIERSDIEEACQRVLMGSVMLHGLKSQEAFDAVVRTYWNRNNPLEAA